MQFTAEAVSGSVAIMIQLEELRRLEKPARFVRLNLLNIAQFLQIDPECIPRRYDPYRCRESQK
jgi:hypothetical protein